MALIRNIVILSIVAFALLGTMAYYLNTVAISTTGKETEAAGKAARKRLDRLREMTYDDLQAAYPHGTPVHFLVEGLDPVPPDPAPGSVTITYPNVTQAEVVIRVRWKGHGQEASIPPLTWTLTPP
jgi:type II secretory pathway pseudopilin PulG